MKNKQIILCTFLFSIFSFLVTDKCVAQDFKEVLAKADTINFSSPRNNDWQLLNSYMQLNKTKDTVQLELIVLSDKKEIDWKNEQYIGKIKFNKFFAKEDRYGLCYLLNDVYRIKIEKDGKCYFKLEKGNPPSGFPTVIPLRVNYSL